jgi:hypothetical protein
MSLHIRRLNILLFYLVIQAGSITGAVFGVVDVLRDTKAMRASTKVATAKVWNRTYMFGG